MKNNIASIIDLPKIYDPRGSLTVAEENIHVPFEMGQIEWWAVMDSCTERHLWRECSGGKLAMVALAGSLTVNARLGDEEVEVSLCHPYQLLLLDDGVSFRLEDCSTDTVVLLIYSKTTNILITKSDK